jgi:hypothetical protein
MSEESAPPKEAASQGSADIEQVSLPPVIPPQTAAPVQFNQQVNLSIQQIPASAWDRLNPEQIVEVTKMIVNQIEATDQRHFDFATESVRRRSRGMTLAVICGTVITVAGYAATAWLALQGHELAAAFVALPLTTVLAMVVGNRFLS